MNNIKKTMFVIVIILFFGAIPSMLNFAPAKAKNVSTADTTEEITAKIKEPVKKEVKLKNAIKIKYKLVDDSKDRAYTMMYFRDLNSRHNIGFGYEYTDSKKDKRAFLLEYTYKF